MGLREELIELRESTGMNRREFCEYFEIPYRTVQDWEAGKREMPKYLLDLMKYRVMMENIGTYNRNDREEEQAFAPETWEKRKEWLLAQIETQ